MRTTQNEFIDTIIDPIPVVGPLLGDMFYIWSGLVDAMNLRGLALLPPTLPPGDNVVVLAPNAPPAEIRKAD